MMNPMQQMAGNMIQSMAGNNPLLQLVGMIGRVPNPQQILGQFLQQNPSFNQAMPFVQGKNESQLKQTFYNLCKEHNLDPEKVAQSVGVTIPK